jgi:TRAP-type C4-dicarboxylate transport system permease small subunit
VHPGAADKLFQVKRDYMRHRLSARQRLVCGAIGLCTCAAYFGFCLHAVGITWQREEGDLPSVSAPLDAVTLFLVAFPFGFLSGFGSILVAPMLNALLWGTVAGVIYVRLARRSSA